MLLLGRRCGQRIRIGKDIWVTVTEIVDGNVTLGVDAPIDVNILRNELIKDEFTYKKYEENKCKTPKSM